MSTLNRVKKVIVELLNVNESDIGEYLNINISIQNDVNTSSLKSFALTVLKQKKQI